MPEFLEALTSEDLRLLVQLLRLLFSPQTTSTVRYAIARIASVVKARKRPKQ